MFVPRQLLSGELAFVACVGMGLTVLPRSLRTMTILGILAWESLALRELYDPLTCKPPYRDVAAVLDNEYADQTVYTVESWVYIPLKSYRLRGPVRSLAEIPEPSRREGFVLAWRHPTWADALFPAEVTKHSQKQRFSWGDTTHPAEIAIYVAEPQADPPVPSP